VGGSQFKASQDKKFERPYCNNDNKKLGGVVHACHPSNGGKRKIGGSWSRLAQAKSKKKINRAKRARGMAEAV
jgi:hypothetical protein